MGNFLLGLFIGWTVTTVTTVVMYATGVEVRWIADWLQDRSGVTGLSVAPLQEKPAPSQPAYLEAKAAQEHAARMTPEQRMRWIADWLQDKPARPGPVSLEVLIKAAQAHAARMTPEQRAEQTAAFRRSWVIGDLSIRHPEMSREDIERLVDDVIADMQSGEN